MAYKCSICAKGPVAGKSYSHSHKATKRIFKPNLHKQKIVLNGITQTAYVCSTCLRGKQHPVDFSANRAALTKDIVDSMQAGLEPLGGNSNGAPTGLESAIANAENNHNLDVDDLFVAEAWVGKNLTLKRGRPRARGRFGKILKPFAELTILVRQKEEQA